jgi:ankyrin repeat protein
MEDKTDELIKVAGAKFLFAASLGRNSVKETLDVVDKMGTPNFQLSCGLTLLHMAVQYNRSDLVKALLERGADTELKTDHGETPLDQAAWKGFIEPAILLLKHGANVNCQTNLGFTPLHRF